MPNNGLRGFPKDTKAASLIKEQTWTADQTLAADINTDVTDTRSIGSSIVQFNEIWANTFFSNQQSFYGSLPPVQVSTTITGNDVQIQASDATAGSSIDGAEDGGSISLTTGAAKRKNSGNADGGDVEVRAGTGIGTGVSGHLSIFRGRVETKVTNDFPTTSSTTGFGAGPTVGFLAGKGDFASLFQAVAGAGAGSSGTVVIAFSGALGTNTPVVTVTLQNGTGTWDARATVRLSSVTTAGYTINWDNNGVALTNTSGYLFAIHAIGT